MGKRIIAYRWRMAVEWLGPIFKVAEWIAMRISQKKREDAQERKETARHAREQVTPIIEKLAEEVSGLLSSLAQDPCPVWIHLIEENARAGLFPESPKLVAFSKVLDKCQLPVFEAAGFGDLAQHFGNTMVFLYGHSRTIQEWHISFRDHLMRMKHYPSPAHNAPGVEHVLNWCMSSVQGQNRYDMIYYAAAYANRTDAALAERTCDALNRFYNAHKGDIDHAQEALQSSLRECLKVFGFTHPVISSQAALSLSTLDPKLRQLRQALEDARAKCCL